MAAMQTALAVLLVVLTVWGQEVGSVNVPGGWGRCPEPPVKEDFDVGSYPGTWYEYQRFPTAFEALVKCGQADYEFMNETAISVNNTGIREIKIAGRTIYKKRTNALGVATIPDLNVPAKLVVSFGGGVVPSFAKGNYWVLATDYSSYSLVYSCSSLPFGFAHIDAAWILTRGRGIPPDNLDDLHNMLRDGGVDPDNFFTVDQTDCSLD